MRSVNMLQAKSTLSRLVEAIELGREAEIVIARNGRPAASWCRFPTSLLRRRASVWRKDCLKCRTTSMHANGEIAELFAGVSKP
jgi:hypothetical protein